MKISTRKNKLLFVNSMLYLIAFVILIIYLSFPSLDLSGDGHQNLFRQIFLSLVSEYALQIIIIMFLLIISILYLIQIFISLFKKIKLIKTSILIMYQICFFLLSTFFLILEINTKMNIIYEYFYIFTILPVFLFAIYNLVSTIIYINKIKKKEIIETR